jgi:hypothetical protein
VNNLHGGQPEGQSVGQPMEDNLFEGQPLRGQLPEGSLKLPPGEKGCLPGVVL